MTHAEGCTDPALFFCRECWGAACGGCGVDTCTCDTCPHCGRRPGDPTEPTTGVDAHV